jgi:homoserine O-acetyltransferase
MKISVNALLRHACLVLVLCCSATVADSEQQFAIIGDLPLESGDILQDVRIGYRIAGTLNADKSNVMVFPTWFTGSSGDYIQYGLIGPGKLADTDRYYVVIIDALANGISSSPSNSSRQAGALFPLVTIDDMVASQHILLTRHLGIEHARVVMGISMGGMQTFQWMGQYPEFMDKAIPIDGSPRMTSYDLLQWQTHLQAIEMLQAAGVSNREITKHLASLNLLTLWTPTYFVENVPPEKLPEMITEAEQGYASLDAYDYAAQLRAMIGHDVYAADTAGQPGYVESVTADVLVIGVASDHMVNPVPGKKLAATLNARRLEIQSNCGHIGSSCEGASVIAAVHEFLE